MRTPSQQRYQAIRRVTVVGAVVNVVLAILKVVFGFIGQSHALISDGIHSFSDLASDLLVVFAAKHSNEDADENHPYGHARIETAFTVALGVFLILVALGLIIDAGQRLLQPEKLLQPTAWALLIAAVSIGAKEWLYHYTVRVAKRVHSGLLRANAWHHRSDAISSVVVLIGVAGSMLGLAYLDAFASVAVALMIAKIGWDQGWQAVSELVDTGLEPERVAEIEEAIEQVEGVKDMHTLRTRRMGGEALVDVHVQVNPRLSVSEGHYIGEYVRTQLLENFSEISDVTVHIDPEDDETSRLSDDLPLRRDITPKLREAWQELIDPALIKTINLHYLNGKIDVEVILPLSAAKDMQHAKQLAAAFYEKGLLLDRIDKVNVYFA